MLENIFHKVKKEEIDRVVEALTTAFIDYPLYKVFFPIKNEKKYRRKVKESFYFKMYVLPDSFYCNDDLTCIACIASNKDKIPNPFLAVLRHPLFLLRGIFTVYNFADYRRFIKNSKISAQFESKYKKSDDLYFHILATVGEGRSGESIFKLLYQDEVKDSIFCITHTVRNVRLYEHVGFKLVDQTNWNDITYYCLRRE